MCLGFIHFNKILMNKIQYKSNFCISRKRRLDKDLSFKIFTINRKNNKNIEKCKPVQVKAYKY